jgi:6-phospho-3-hexuloisomerase
MIIENANSILEEIKQTLSTTDEEQVQEMITEILKANKIVTLGAGRVGMACRGFAMRLGHLGLNAYQIGDATVPHIGKGDLLLVSSGSGETQTIVDMTQIAKTNEATIVLVTNNKESRIGRLADKVVEIHPIFEAKLQSMSGTGSERTMIAVKQTTSKQPMSTLNEQSLTIFYDAVVLEMMSQMNETADTMKARHSNLE